MGPADRRSEAVAARDIRIGFLEANNAELKEELSTIREQVAPLEAHLVESEQALTVANASWTEAVRQRDTRIVELEAQLEELHEWTSSDERERLVLDLQRCHESLDKAMRERDSYMCTADSAEQKHTELLGDHVKATGDLGRALLEIGRLKDKVDNLAANLTASRNAHDLPAAEGKL